MLMRNMIRITFFLAQFKHCFLMTGVQDEVGSDGLCDMCRTDWGMFNV